MRLLIKLAIITVICLVLFSGTVNAENLYVTDVLKLTLRTGPSTENRIISVIQSGQRLEVLEPGDEWSYVRLADGKEGWVLTRYLTPDPPASILLEQIKQKYENLTNQATALMEENKQLKSENQKLGSAASSNEKELSELRDDYETLKSDSAEILSLKSKYEKTAAKLAEQNQNVSNLEQQLSRVEQNQYIWWFLAGSGVLLVGFLIGFSARRQRRRTSLY